jgi:hypothetical protein
MEHKIATIPNMAAKIDRQFFFNVHRVPALALNPAGMAAAGQPEQDDP